jgi:hypothetical protein
VDERRRKIALLALPSGGGRVALAPQQSTRPERQNDQQTIGNAEPFF